MNSESLNLRLNELEADMNRLIAENERLIRARESAYVELNACAGLLIKLAVKTGLTAGITQQNIAVLELPSGQVTWEFESDEAHLFEQLPPYEKEIEVIPVIEKYRRIMNPEG